MRAVQYIFINKGLGMSTGKTAAQAAHAACLGSAAAASNWGLVNGHDPALLTAQQKKHIALFENWWMTGHYTKFVMEVPDTETLDSTERYINDRGYKTFMVIDEGRTEDTYFKKTALAIELVDKDDPLVREIFGEFKLYRDEPHLSEVGSSTPDS